MLKVGLVGLGFMGSSHLSVYKQLMDEGYPVKLVAICDVNEEKRTGKLTQGNIDVSDKSIDFTEFSFYTNMEEMIENEELDYVDICLPTYLHAPYAIKAMEKGLHVFCEKPMAISTKACQEMIDARNKYNRYLMIGQTLRFFPSYQYIKKIIDDKTYGELNEVALFRGGTTPLWSWDNWLLDKERSGGCLLDQHIHDVDTINWLLGTPKAVYTNGKVYFDGSGYDMVSTNYIFDNKVVNAQDNWTINNDDFGFEMRFRFSFKKGTIILENGKLTDYPNNKKSFAPQIDERSGYYLEIKHFAQSILDDVDPQLACPLESTMETIRIAEAEIVSADTNKINFLDK
ncbi:Gfo/Idh/MocA family oxidoreductase [Ligilactobacillus sp. WILCCON 0076]|uniref:Gfo/Idh/MocA family oxidoreductase n=1 Tax=Ligilactobacillus ubinensis TaxID=2876789 RepID=A0A9X2FH94_9LACO|nr:Gfo/Idh/MocA family oxidoreductase [Ligilactobacillus ubinensis]MCP0885774.1 Gfo/Idh/MocA family oxidoreductase [Ligilactobacillus ubinensis]